MRITGFLLVPFSSLPCSFIVFPLSHSYSSDLPHLPRLAVLCGQLEFLSSADVYFLPRRVVSAEIVILIPTVFYRLRAASFVVRRRLFFRASVYVYVHVFSYRSMVRVSHQLTLCRTSFPLPPFSFPADLASGQDSDPLFFGTLRDTFR